MTAVTEFSPAKINLSLHVLGRRDDGYHLLESLVAFTGIGDAVTVEKAPSFTLTATGPFAGELPEPRDNIVIAAAHALAHGFGDIPPGAAIRLEKNLPVAAGIGGGSANAAACLRALLKLNDASMSETALHQIAVGLGADVPVCLRSRASLMSGVGQIVEPAPELPKVHAVLVNPRVPVPTGPVFQALGLEPGATLDTAGPALPKARFHSAEELAGYLRECRNDLEPPAAAAVREIADVESALFALDGCLLARMSGSGATCFGLFARETEAAAAAAQLAQSHEDWWVAATPLS
ncbi:MAG: 4-(cytidine 5'-diphospho)-2-C-methyl-D-erythritol kinase [Hyphomicrobiales bacterium]